MTSANKEFLEKCRQGKAAQGKPQAVHGVIFARVSDEDKEADISCEVQIAKCKSYAKTHRIRIKKVFQEQKSSMEPKRRAVFLEMLNYVNENDIDCVIVFNLSRFGRDMEQMLRHTREFREVGKRVISTQEDYGDDANGRFVQNIALSVNEYHVVRAADDTFTCLLKIAEKGRVTGQVPYGLKSEKVKGSKEKRYAIDKGPAKVVRFIFQSVADGLSYESIRAELKRQGIKTRFGKGEFSNGYINSILSNVKYKGWMRYNRQDKPKKSYRVTRIEADEILIPNVIPAIVSEELFDKVQEILAGRKKGSHDGIGLDGSYILKGKTRCKCGRTMHGTSKSNRVGKSTQYYHCPEHNGAKGSCCVKDVNKKYLEHTAFSIIGGIVNNPAVQAQVISKIDARKAEVMQSVQRAKGDLSGATERHEKFVDNLGECWDSNTMAAVRKKIESSATDIEKLKGILNGHQDNLEYLEQLRSSSVPLQKPTEYANTDKRRLVERLIESIVIDNDKATITLRT